MQSEAGHIEIKLTTDALNDGKMYVEYVNHQKPNTMLQAQGLKLLTEDGVMEQFVVMSPSGEGLSKWGSIVTKQNEDGTISVTTVNGMHVFDFLYFISSYCIKSNSRNSIARE